jgi:hypothetical protein
VDHATVIDLLFVALDALVVVPFVLWLMHEAEKPYDREERR